MGKAKFKPNYAGAASVAIPRKKSTTDTRDYSLTSPLIVAVVFSVTIFTSASLLFMTQPLIAKMLLPLMGGAPAVWTTCMLFFQSVLLLGYGYAHISGTRLTFKAQVGVQAILIVAAAGSLPFAVPHLEMVASSASRILVVFALLAVTAGVPFFVLSSSAPLLQKWFSRTNHPQANDPYFLYAASNFGSMLVLFSYPTIIEPSFGLVMQSRLWAVGYVFLAAAYAACAYLVFRSPAAGTDEGSVVEEDEDERPDWTQRVGWVARAFVPSSLMLGVTTYFTTDIATIPLLWVLPLTLYLATYIFVFMKIPDYVHRGLVIAAPILVVGLICHILMRPSWSTPSTLFFHLVTFFVVTMVFHGEIARTRPSSRYLTEFYWLMSVGGVLGGVFNGVLAPIFFKTAAEYPVALALSCVLLPGYFHKARRAESLTKRITLDVIGTGVVGGLTAWLALSYPLSGIVEMATHRDINVFGPAAIALAFFVVFRRQTRMGLAVAAFTFVSFSAARVGQDVVHLDRSFFGILKVYDEYYGQYRTLLNGTTLHGRQSREDGLRRQPLTYYHRQGPVGSIFEEFQGSDRSPDYAVIGLGTGTLSSYAQPGQKVTFYEIDDAVVNVARNHFTYLGDSPGAVSIVMGDARLKLAEAPSGAYGLILVDAFSSDAIPVHLLTQEAIQLYFSKLGERGIVAIHTSNRYLRLEPVLGVIAKDARLTARVMSDTSDNDDGKLASTWVVLTRDERSLGSLAENKKWRKLEGYLWIPTWTDDFTSILPILR